MPLNSLYFLDVYGYHTADSKPVKQEVNGTMILPPLVFLALAYLAHLLVTMKMKCCEYGPRFIKLSIENDLEYASMTF